MSVINQVLNQLEQRGAHTAPEQTMVHAVPRGERKLVMPLLALLLALAAGIATWQWMQMRKPVLSSVEVPKAVAASAVRPQPVVAMPVPAPAVPVPVAASTVAASDALPAGMLPPASRLSFELSSIPLPSALRQHPEPALRDARNGVAASRVKVPAPEEGCPEPCRRGEGRLASAAPPVLAKPEPARTASPNVRAAVQPSDGGSPMKQVSTAQHADAEFRRAVVLMQQGHITDAIAGYEAALLLDAGHDAARQALVALLLEGKRSADAERVLQEGLKNKPEHTGFAMLLARLQVERGAVEQATATLEKSLPYADSQAGYQAFFAALLQRQNRHKEAIDHYQMALYLVPNNGVWLMGYGISLQAVQRTDDAKGAFRRAIESKTLNPELQAFVLQKLKDL